MTLSVVTLALTLSFLRCNAAGYSFNPRHVLLGNLAGPVDTRSAPSILDEPSPYFDVDFQSGNVPSEVVLREMESLFYIHVEQESAFLGSNIMSGLANDFSLRFKHYLPHNTWIVRTNLSVAKRLARSSGVLWVGNVHPTHKFYSEKISSPKFPKSLNVILEAESSSICTQLARDLNLRNGTSAICSRLDRMRIDTDTLDNLIKITLELAKNPNVLFVERVLEFGPFNKWSPSIVLEGNQLDWYRKSQEPLNWNKNLEGQGQIVGLADTGLDRESCFFKESLNGSKGVDPVVTWRQGGPLGGKYVNPGALNNRKVIQYVDPADATDEKNGHGSHTSGSVAGALPPGGEESTLFPFRGLAPKAKLAFFDVSDESNAQAGGGFKIPDDVQNDLLKWAYEAGARIHSDSWGSVGSGYSAITADFDEFVWNHKDFLPVIAVGNSGDKNELRTLGEPATLKNGLGVGASMNTQASLSFALDQAKRLPNGDSAKYLDRMKDILLTDTGLSNYDFNDLAFFTSIGPTDDYRIKPDVVSPGLFTFSARAKPSSYNCFPNDPDTGVVIMAGTSMATPTLSGTMALIRQYFTDGYYPTGSKSLNNAFVPSASLLRNIAIHSASLMDGFKYYKCSGGVGTQQPMPTSNPGLPPGWPSQMPPDFQSLADSDEEVSSGICRSNLSSSENTFWMQGWGRTQANKALFFSGSEALSGYLHIPSLTSEAAEGDFNDMSIKSNESITFNVCAFPSTSMPELRATLTWTDYPGSPNAKSALVNDLDLKIVYNDKTLYGNEMTFAAYKALMGSDFDGQEGDRFNNIEKIIMNLESISSPVDISITISGYKVPQGPQPFSLVVSGNIGSGSCNSTSKAGPAAPFLSSSNASSSHSSSDQSQHKKDNLFSGALDNHEFSAAAETIPFFWIAVLGFVLSLFA